MMHLIALVFACICSSGYGRRPPCIVSASENGCDELSQELQASLARFLLALNPSAGLCASSVAALQTGFSSPAHSCLKAQTGVARARVTPECCRWRETSIAMNASENDSPVSRVDAAAKGISLPQAIYNLNSATKWLVVLAQTAAVVLRRDFIAPFIVIGSISAAFGTAVLKKLINQQRPDGAPFTDPGMPSSHALVSSFAAVAWACHLQSCVPTVLLMMSAALVSILRVVCGYHDWAQVLVGATLGGVSACAWMAFGSELLRRIDPQVATAAVWACYFGGSALFIGKKMASWTQEDAAL